MQISLNEPSNFRYIRIHPTTKNIRLRVPLIAGLNISTDNTCKLGVEVNAFFEGGAIKELESYKSTLEFHLCFLEEGDARYRAKKKRLTQINLYLNALMDMRHSYKSVVKSMLARPSNLYSIQLRPRIQDPCSVVVNPVFTINRGNDFLGNPLSSLYNKMHEIFPGATFGKADPREELMTKVLKALPPNASFKKIQDVLTAQCQVPEDFFKKRLDEHRQEQVVDKAYIDELMRFDENTQPQDYISALLGLCAPNFQTTLQGSPFYLESSVIPDEKAERLSILTQFYLGVLNVYCRGKGISNKNFGKILDSSPALSQALVDLIVQALSHGADVEPALIAFFNGQKKTFNLSRELTSDDKDAIQQKFETTYRTVTATKENPHMDDFMLLDTEARGKNDIFITSDGLICTDFSHIAPVTPQSKAYFAEIHNEACTHHNIVTLQEEPGTTVDIVPEALIDKLSDEQWDKLPGEIVDACHALPAFKIRKLLDDVAKGKQEEANAILQAAEDIQTLLRTPSKLTDYSGRTFYCTAYEYAYWAKDTHMCRMLKRHMDDETKALMLEKVNEMERSGLAYQQHGLSYKNAHYDMSFILKDLNSGEFHYLKAMLGQQSNKLNMATKDNYKTVSFTATEYEQLKKALAQQNRCRFVPTGFASFFIPSPAKKLSNKLKFDFHSLITALDTYVTHYDKWSEHERDVAWMSVGKAQRDVTAHIANECCRQDRSFHPLPSFNEKMLPRDLTFANDITNNSSWFPLSSSFSGLGFDFALTRAGRATRARAAVGETWSVGPLIYGPDVDLAAIRHLDEVRTADLALLREHLSLPDETHDISVVSPQYLF